MFIDGRHGVSLAGVQWPKARGADISGARGVMGDHRGCTDPFYVPKSNAFWIFAAS